MLLEELGAGQHEGPPVGRLGGEADPVGDHARIEASDASLSEHLPRHTPHLLPTTREKEGKGRQHKKKRKKRHTPTWNTRTVRGFPESEAACHLVLTTSKGCCVHVEPSERAHERKEGGKRTGTAKTLQGGNRLQASKTAGDQASKTGRQQGTTPARKQGIKPARLRAIKTGHSTARRQ